MFSNSNWPWYLSNPYIKGNLQLMKLLLLLLFLLPSLCFGKDIIYQNYKFSIPGNYSLHNNGKPLNPGSIAIHIVNEKKKGVAMVDLVRKEKKNFWSLEDYGAQNYRELFYVIFTDKPSNNEAVKELREFDAKYELQKFEISARDDFVFFKSTNPMNMVGNVKYLISTPINDQVLNVDFTTPDKEIESSVINSLQVK